MGKFLYRARLYDEEVNTVAKFILIRETKREIDLRSTRQRFDNGTNYFCLLFQFVVHLSLDCHYFVFRIHVRIFTSLSALRDLYYTHMYSGHSLEKIIDNIFCEEIENVKAKKRLKKRSRNSKKTGRFVETTRSVLGARRA